VAYEIRVVFQTMEAYQNAVDRLYAAFGVGLPPPQEVPSGASGERAEHVFAAPEAPDANVERAEHGSAAPEAPDVEIAEEPDPPPDGYGFVVEDRTR
jgi:hypothetical protein